MKSHDYSATVVWTRDPDAAFTDNRYSRAHRWKFDEGVEVFASSSPLVLPPPLSKLDAVDPEEAFVASLASCHMLFFLAYSAKRGLVVDRYEDSASGTMGTNAEGRTAMLKVVLRPRVTWSGTAPAADTIGEIHHRSHEDCFIANSVRTEVVVEARD